MEDNQLRETMLRDLDLQWRDHFHMRDQTWKTLSNSALLFLGVVGLEIKDAGDLVMIPAYMVLVAISILGWTVASHHRIRQGQKFAIIQLYEEKLGLYALKKDILETTDKGHGLAGKIFTARFIELMHGAIGLVAVALLVARTIAT